MSKRNQDFNIRLVKIYICSKIDLIIFIYLKTFNFFFKRNDIKREMHVNNNKSLQ